MTNSWNQHLRNLISLHSRAKNMQESLLPARWLENRLSPSMLLDKLRTAREVEKMYSRAARMWILLQENQEPGSHLKIDHIKEMIDRGASQSRDIIKILNHKANKLGVGEQDPDTLSSPGIQDIEFQDMNASDDRPTNQTRSHVKSALRSLLHIVDYMDQATLVVVLSHLDKLIKY